MDQDEKKDELVIQKKEIDETKKTNDEDEGETMTDDKLVGSNEENGVEENDAEEADKPQTKKTQDKKVEEFVNLTKAEADFIKWLRKKEGSWPTLKECGIFLKSPKGGVLDFIDELRVKKSYDIRLETGRVVLSREPISGEELKLDPIKRDSFTFIVCSDLWLGNKFSQPTLLATLGAVAQKEKVDVIFVAGNLLTEKSRKSKNRVKENFYPSEKWLIRYALKVIPKVYDSEKGEYVKWHILGGSSDMGYKETAGFTILAALCRLRKDLIYRGDEEIKFVTRNKKFRGLILHPGKEEVLQSKSYPVEGVAQNVIDLIKQSGEPLPNVIFMGGWGTPIEIPRYESGVWIFGLPSLRTLTSSMKKNKKRGIVPTLGFWRIKIKFHNDEIQEVKYKFVDLSRYQIKNDYLGEPKIRKQSVVAEDLTDLEKKVLGALTKGERLGEISSQIGLNKESILPIIKSLTERGFKIERDKARKKYLLDFEVKTKFKPLPLDDLFYARAKIGHCSDTHYGDKGQQKSAHRDFYEKCAQENVKIVTHTGDVVEGRFHTHPESEKRVFLHGFDAQLRYLIENYPRPPKDKDGKYLFKTVMIKGSHDETYDRIANEQLAKIMKELGTGNETYFEQVVGLDILEKFAEARDDIIYLKKMVANFDLPVEKDGKIIGRIRFRLHHPKGHSSAFLSAQIQKLIEIFLKRIGATGEETVDVCLFGNYHKAVFMKYRGIYAFSVPAFTTGGDFMDLVSYSWIGGIINEWTLSKDGKITAVEIEFFPYTPKEHDY